MTFLVLNKREGQARRIDFIIFSVHVTEEVSTLRLSLLYHCGRRVSALSVGGESRKRYEGGRKRVFYLYVSWGGQKG